MEKKNDRSGMFIAVAFLGLLVLVMLLSVRHSTGTQRCGYMTEFLFSLSPRGMLPRPTGKAVGIPTPAAPRLRGDAAFGRSHSYRAPRDSV